MKTFEFVTAGRDPEVAKGFLTQKWVDKELLEGWGFMEEPQAATSEAIIGKLRARLRSADGKRYWASQWEELAKEGQTFHSAEFFSAYVRRLASHARKAAEFSALEPTEEALWSIIRGQLPRAMVVRRATGKATRGERHQEAL